MGGARLGFALVIAAVLSAVLVQPAHAKPPEGVTIDAEVGYNGYVALASVNPVIVNLENSSANTNLSGEIALSHNGVEYVSKLELPAPSKKRLFLYSKPHGLQRIFVGLQDPKSVKYTQRSYGPSF